MHMAVRARFAPGQIADGQDRVESRPGQPGGELLVRGPSSRVGRSTADGNEPQLLEGGSKRAESRRTERNQPRPESSTRRGRSVVILGLVGGSANGRSRKHPRGLQMMIPRRV